MLCNFIKITLLHGWSPVTLLRFCRTSFSEEHLWRDVLDIYAKTKNTSVFSFQFINVKVILMKMKIRIWISFFKFHFPHCVPRFPIPAFQDSPLWWYLYVWIELNWITLFHVAQEKTHAVSLDHITKYMSNHA